VLHSEPEGEMNKLKLVVAASALVLAACGEAAKTIGDQPLQPIEEFSIQFPRDFSGGVEYREHRVDSKTDPINILENSNFSPFSQESVLGCLVTNGGNDFTVVMRNANQDQLRIRIQRLRLRESQSDYQNLAYVSLDGYSPSRNIMLNSAVQPQVTSPACSAKLWLNGNSLAGDISCPTVNTVGSTKQVEVYVKLNRCQVVSQ
jgi:hypothetical protein